MVGYIVHAVEGDKLYQSTALRRKYSRRNGLRRTRTTTQNSNIALWFKRNYYCRATQGGLVLCAKHKGPSAIASCIIIFRKTLPPADRGTLPLCSLCITMRIRDCQLPVYQSFGFVWLLGAVDCRSFANARNIPLTGDIYLVVLTHSKPNRYRHSPYSKQSHWSLLLRRQRCYW